ncbi:MAG TPA: DUF6036 family nucleotidyltransferase, partial [archaeon]|nr:DUF6036 family nucleotidyltransferase [archaeon]
MIGLEEQIELFKLIGRELEEKVECFVIGGSAMLFYGLKSATKDVDLVFIADADRKQLVKTLENIGFEPKSYSIFKYEKAAENKPLLMERKDTRFDLFLNEIISTKLSAGIKGRITQKHEFSNFIVNTVSPEDIILLKCATERAGDRKDAADIIKSRKIDWDTIINEALWQTEHGKRVFTVYLFDFMMELKEDYKLDIPTEHIKKITKLYENEMMKIDESRKK